MKRGFIAGAFDVIHPGYIAMFKEAKQHCDYLIIGLHADPTVERPEKIKLTLNYQDRYDILMSIKYIDQVYSYELEGDLFNLLKEIKPDIRFLGDDYKNKNITGEELNTPIYYINRDHNWSTTKFKKLIAENYYEKSSMVIERVRK